MESSKNVYKLSVWPDLSGVYCTTFSTAMFPQPVAFQHAGSCSCAAAREPQVAEWCSIAIHIIYALTYVLYRPHTVILYDEHYSG